MPAVKPAYNPNDKDWRDEIDGLADEERGKRAADIQKRWDWYEGRHPDPLKPLPDKLNDNVKYNLCGRGIDKENEFIGIPSRVEVPGGVSLEHVDGTPEQKVTPEQQLADAYYARIEPELGDIKQSGMVSGHTFFKLFVDMDDDGVERAEFALIDPQLVTVFWERGKGSRARALWYRLQWVDGDRASRQDIVPVCLTRPELDERGRVIVDFRRGWEIIEYEEQRGSGRFVETFRDEWIYPFAPMLDGRNKSAAHQFYGKATLDDSIIGLNHAVNFLASNTTRIIKFHAHPHTIAPGVDPAQIQETSIDGLWTIPEVKTPPFNLEMQSDLASSMAMLGEVKAQVFAQLRVLDTASIKDKLGQITNFGVRMLFDDQIEMTEDLRDAYGWLVCELVRRLSVIDGAELPQMEAKWDEPLPVNRLELVQTAAIEKDKGFASTVTLQTDLGRDPETEAARKEVEREEEAERMAAMQPPDAAQPFGRNGNGVRG